MTKSKFFHFILATKITIGIFCDMANDMDRQKLKSKAVELAYAARTVMQQLANKDRTREGFAALDVLEAALLNAIPDGNDLRRLAKAGHPK